LCELEDVAKCWEEYIPSLFCVATEENDGETVSYESVPSKLKEVQWALQYSEVGKVTGLDEVVLEMLIAFQTNAVDILWWSLSKCPLKCSGLFTLLFPKILTHWSTKTTFKNTSV